MPSELWEHPGTWLAEHALVTPYSCLNPIWSKTGIKAEVPLHCNSLLTCLGHRQRLGLSLHVRDLVRCLSIVRAEITNVLDLIMTMTMANTTAGSEPERAAPLPA